MKKQIRHQNLSSKLFTPFLLIVFYWFYTSISFGYFLSKIFYHFFDTIHKNSLSKRIQFRKKFHFKNIIKTIIDFCWKLLKDWFLRIFQKSLLFIRALDRSVTAIKIFLKKFKSLLKFKHNFRLLKNLLGIFSETFLIFCSLVNEILFLNNIINWLIEWRNLIRFLMKESLFITTIVYALYWILLGLFGVLLGFLLGLYRPKDEIDDTYLYSFCCCY